MFTVCCFCIILLSSGNVSIFIDPFVWLILAYESLSHTALYEINDHLYRKIYLFKKNIGLCQYLKM